MNTHSYSVNISLLWVLFFIRLLNKKSKTFLSLRVIWLLLPVKSPLQKLIVY